MNKIEFKQTSNIFINAGIVALHRYIKKYVYEYPDKHIVSENKLEKDKLVIQCDNLLDLLEDVYYFMGEEYYETITSRQLEEKGKFYFKRKPFEAIPFSKIKTLGYASILTKNPPVTKGKGGEKIKFDKLVKEEPDLAYKIAEFLHSNNRKLKFYTFNNGKLQENETDSNNKRKENRGGDSEIFINAGYTTIPQLEFNSKYLLTGNKKCPLLGENFKYLIKNKSSSPFLAGLPNFNSFFDSEDKAISWKALLLLRFSPVLAFYHYRKGYDRLICHFINSNNLENINNLSDPILYKSKMELQNQPLPYSSNFNFIDFTYNKKDSKISDSEDAIISSELSFLMLYTFYHRNFKNKITEKNVEGENYYFDPFINHPLEKVPITIIYFKSDDFSSILRPNEYEEFSNVKFIFRFIYYLEHQMDVKIKDIWYGLKIRTPKSDNYFKKRSYNKAKYEERKIRAEVFYNILKGKSILSQIERLFYDSFNNRINGFDTGYRRYGKILNFLLEYEQTLKSIDMDKELQKNAINLGKSIGQGILRFEESDKLTNAKSGRKYLIGLHKSRTLQQFLDGLYRIANKYGIAISNNILENIDEDNFLLIRQFALIGALNQLNMTLGSKSNNN